MNENFTRTVNFTTSSTNYELLNDTNVKAAIIDRFRWTETGAELDDKYSKYIEGGNLSMKVTIVGLSGGTGVSINGSYYNPAILDSAYDTEGYVYGLKSVKIQNANISGTLMFKIN